MSAPARTRPSSTTRPAIDRKVGRPIRVKLIVDVDWSRSRPLGMRVPKEVQTTDALALIDDPEISIVVESIGGIKPSLDFVLAALRTGKNVVTSNKELVARHGKELFDAAAERSVDLPSRAASAVASPSSAP